MMCFRDLLVCLLYGSLHHLIAWALVNKINFFCNTNQCICFTKASFGHYTSWTLSFQNVRSKWLFQYSGWVAQIWFAYSDQVYQFWWLNWMYQFLYFQLEAQPMFFCVVSILSDAAGLHAPIPTFIILTFQVLGWWHLHHHLQKVILCALIISKQQWSFWHLLYNLQLVIAIFHLYT